MNRALVRMSVVASLAVVALAAFLLPPAQSQGLVSPSYIPIGVATSGGSSTAWFHQPSTGRILACQSVGSAAGSGAGIECVATKLP